MFAKDLLQKYISLPIILWTVQCASNVSTIVSVLLTRKSEKTPVVNTFNSLEPVFLELQMTLYVSLLLS